MSVAADDPRPKKVQISDTIRREITSGSRPTGQKLPSVRALAKHFEVTPVTASSALQILVDEGLLTSVPNRGYFVVQPEEPLSAPMGGVDMQQRLEDVTSQLSELRDRVDRLEAERSMHAAKDQ
ncbi:GntR family transcriptional regulator [Streptomyces sp. NPDC046853]|uniref:GntR family transcriptional regulator n=1 Tax=Streptomyces sp. NPDC046853 TaxID=3154920 RepID=UPI0033C548AD